MSSKRVDVTIVNGAQMSKKNRKAQRRARRNPSGGGSFAGEAGRTLGGVAIGAAAAIVADRVLARVAPTSQTFTPKVKAGLLAGVGVVAGVGLHYKGMAPNVGTGLAGASAGIGGSELVALYGLEARLLPQRAPAAPAPQSLGAGGAGATAPTAGVTDFYERTGPQY